MTAPIAKPRFGERLRALMLECGLSQSSLARKSGVERSVICRIIAGKANPRPEQIGWMAKVLGVDAAELLLETDVSPEFQQVIVRLRVATDRIAQLERERDEALAQLERFRRDLAAHGTNLISGRCLNS